MPFSLSSAAQVALSLSLSCCTIWPPNGNFILHRLSLLLFRLTQTHSDSLRLPQTVCDAVAFSGELMFSAQSWPSWTRCAEQENHLFRVRACDRQSMATFEKNLLDIVQHLSSRMRRISNFLLADQKSKSCPLESHRMSSTWPEDKANRMNEQVAASSSFELSISLSLYLCFSLCFCRSCSSIPLELRNSGGIGDCLRLKSDKEGGPLGTVSSGSNLQSAIDNVQSAICNRQCAIGELQSAICGRHRSASAVKLGN